MKKAEARKYFLGKRKSLLPDLKIAYEQQCLKQLQNINLGKLTTVMSYKPMLQFNEFDTNLVESYLQNLYDNLTFCYPKIINNDGKMVAITADRNTTFQAATFGTQEPATGDFVDIKNIDVILVPLVIFDESGNRIGYGKGYYDQFLKDADAETSSIGLSLFSPIQQISDVNEQDIPISYAVTPTATYTFSNRNS